MSDLNDLKYQREQLKKELELLKTVEEARSLNATEVDKAYELAANCSSSKKISTSKRRGKTATVMPK